MVNENPFFIYHSPFCPPEMENTEQSHTSRSIFRNVLYGLSTWLLPLILSFYSIRILVPALGDKDYGIYALVLGFISYSFNLSFGRAITKYIAEYRASGENERIRDIISATLFINLTVGIAVILLIFTTANRLVADVLEIAAEDQRKTVLALYVASLTLFFMMLNQVFNSILQGIHRFDVYSKIINFNSVAIISGNILLALNGFGLVALLAWNLAITFVSCLLFIVSAKRHLPEFGVNFNFPGETVKIVLKFSAGVIGYQILANLFIFFERTWIFRKLGAENLTYYVVPMVLAINIHSFVSSIVLVIFPLASELKDDREKLLQLYSKATKIVCFLIVFIELTVVIHSRGFLTLWMSSDPNFAEKTHLILIIHATTFSLLAIQTIAWQMTEGLGYPQFNTFIYAICLMINAVLVLSLSGEYGNDGIAFARLAAFTAMFFSLFYVEKWFFGRIQIKLWLRLIALLGAAAIVSATFQKLTGDYLSLNWASLLFSIGGGGIVYCLTLLLLGFVSGDEKLLIKNLLQRNAAD